MQFGDMITLNYKMFSFKTNTVRGLIHGRERVGGEEGLDRLGGKEEVTVVYILKAEGKLLNYR